MYLLSKATSLKTFFTQMLAYYKILRTFASLLKGSTLTKEFWRGGRKTRSSQYCFYGRCNSFYYNREVSQTV